MQNDIGGPTSLVSIGRGVQVSRLLVGHNPPCGNSHLSADMNDDMRAYFSAENVVAMYQHAEKLGLGTLVIRGDYNMLQWVELYRRGGGKMNVVGQTASEMFDIFSNIRIMAASGVRAIYHHGTQTDTFFQQGKRELVRDYLKCMRDQGVAVGLGTHMPEVIEYAQQHHWDVDFYMACFYNLSREVRQSALVTGRAIYDNEEYLDEDRQKMANLIAAVNKPVLAFKILAAGRHCATQQQVREAYEFAYARIKPADAVVVGFFPKYLDQIALGLEYANAAIAKAAGK